MKKYILAIITILISTVVLAQLPENLDEVTPFNEGLAAVRQGNEWAFIDEDGTVVIDFRNDIYWNKEATSADEGVTAVRHPHFSDGLCMVVKYVDEIPVYGFIDTKGDLVIEHQFLNVRPFKDGFTTGILYETVFRGQNEFKLNIYEYKFHEVLMRSDGEIVDFMNRRYNIQMKKPRYTMPNIESMMLNEQLVAYKKEGNWELKRLNLRTEQ